MALILGATLFAIPIKMGSAIDMGALCPNSIGAKIVRLIFLILHSQTFLEGKADKILSEALAF